MIKIQESKNSSTETEKEKNSVIPVEHGDKAKAINQLNQKQHAGSSKSPKTGERSDWIRAEKQEIRQIPGIMGIKV